MSPNHNLLAQCTSTVLCHLRNIPLWGIVVSIFLLGALRTRIASLVGWDTGSSPAERSEKSSRYSTMASAAGAMRTFTAIALPTVVASAAYAIVRGKLDVVAMANRFLTGPGSTSRIIALSVVLFNWKSLPLAWTVRVFNAMISHILVLPYHTHPPDKLFHPAISQSHASLLEIDYNIHKSNSTYFADLDVSRSHLVSHLFARGCSQLANNVKSKLVMDPRSPDKPAKGRFGVMLGAVHCSFKREIKPYQGYEMWTRVLSWDRKWMYLVTHFVEKGAVKPSSWDGNSRVHADTRGKGVKYEDIEKRIYATAVSKYVFKIGRLTVHPAVLIGASGLLPERPDGWVSTSESESDLSTPQSGMATPVEPVTGNDDLGAETVARETGWNWRRTEDERKKGMEFAKHFAAMDGASSLFDGGEDGALGAFGLG